VLNHKKEEKKAITEADLYKKPLCYFAAFITGLRKCRNLVKVEFYKEPFIETLVAQRSDILKKRVTDFFERLLEVMHAINLIYLQKQKKKAVYSKFFRIRVMKLSCNLP